MGKSYKGVSGRVPDLEEEGTLALQAQAGDTAALDRLIRVHSRWVIKIARDYAQGDPELEQDLVQEGRCGLVRAIEKYEPTRKIRLLSYASWWIRAYIQRYANRSRTVVAVPGRQKQRNLRYTLPSIRAHLAQKLGREATRTEIAEWIRCKESDIIATELQSGELHDFSLDANLCSDGSGDASFLDQLPSPIDEDAANEEASRQARLKSLVDKALLRLTSAEREIIQRRFLLGDDSMRHTLNEIAADHGRSRERIRQIEARAKGKLRTLLAAAQAEL